MLRHTFVHIAGVGPATERRLWQLGARDWESCRRLQARGGISGGRLATLARELDDSEAALAGAEARWFEKRLPASERWRLWPDFGAGAAFLDIETTGLSPGHDRVTVIGLHDGRRFQAFVRGRNLEAFPAAVARHPLLVTFNGASFDLPFLHAEFAGLELGAHLDLRWPLKRLGLAGGLKAIERELGIARPGAVAEVDGFEAVRLWHRHQRGDAEALETLLAYCEQDVANLRPIVRHVVTEMPRVVGFPG